MTILASEIKKIHEEDISANGTVSEGFFKKLAATLNGVVDNFLWDIGDVRTSALSEALFAARNGYNVNLPEEQKRWALMKGQSIVGSKYHALTGVTTLPNMVANGAHSEQAKAGAALLQYLQSQNKLHNHVREIFSYSTYNENSGTLALIDLDLPDNLVGYASSSAPYYPRWINRGVGSYDRLTYNGGDVARPNSVTFNFFLKIND